MTDHQKYQDWLQSRRRVAVPAGFADRVMAQVHATEPVAAPPRLKNHRTLEWFATHALARAAAVLLAAMLAIVQGIVLVRVGLG